KSSIISTVVLPTTEIIEPLFLSIASLVIVEIIRLFKTISFDKIGAIFGELSPIKVISLALLGFMAVAPMVFYDKILNKELNQKQKLSYLLETSWTINSLNNMIGFAGLVDVGLRYSFYGDEERPEKKYAGNFSCHTLFYEWFLTVCTVKFSFYNYISYFNRG
ncbi:MAG: hypothetical protein ACLRK7_10080, partial [Streptococcus salivarius]